jgi:spore coat protein H
MWPLILQITHRLGRGLGPATVSILLLACASSERAGVGDGSAGALGDETAERSDAASAPASANRGNRSRTGVDSPDATGSEASNGGSGCAERDHVLGMAGCVSAAAFDEEVVVNFELRVAQADLQRMVTLARAEETERTYVRAELVVDGEDLGAVGVRYKGAFGTLQTCIGEDDEILCDKMSYKVKFDEYDQDKRWHGLKKVNLHSMRVDETLMHEHLAYRLFRDMGVAASRAVHAQASMNGENMGVFALTEAPDGRFTADRFAPAGDGNLYKEAWPISTDAEYYEADLETNQDEAQDHRPFIEFARALQDASASQLPRVVERFVDVDYLLRYIAVDRAISNWDGVTTFYCWSPEPEHHCRNHNMYWYVDEAGERFWLVPWDLDHTWSPQTEHETIMPPWTEVPDDCVERVSFNDGWLMPPGCDPLLRGLAGGRETAYRETVAELLTGPFQVGKLHAEIDRIAELIAPYVSRDPAIDFATWQQDVEELKSDVVQLRAKAERLRDGR